MQITLTLYMFLKVKQHFWGENSNKAAGFTSVMFQNHISSPTAVILNL